MYGWLKASYTVSRFFGLKTSNFRNKSIANSSMFGKKLPKDFFFTKFTWFRHSFAITDSIESTYYRVGFPKSSIILSSWFSVEFPGKIAFP
jgi:hypothetical protein